jgi:hypothetical protein
MHCEQALLAGAKWLIAALDRKNGDAAARLSLAHGAGAARDARAG